VVDALLIRANSLRQVGSPFVRLTAGIALGVMVTLLSATANHAQAQGETIAPSSPSKSPAPSEFKLSESVSIVVDNEIISSFDVYNRMRWIIYWSKVKTTPEILTKIQALAKQSLVDEHLKLKELKKLGKAQNSLFIMDYKSVEQGIERLAQEKGISATTLLNDLLDLGIDSSTLYNLIQVQISWDGYIRARYGRTFHISPEALTAEFQRRKSALKETQYLVTEIFISSAQAGGDRQADQLASQLWLQMVRDGAPIAGIARQFSAAPSAAREGNIGWISPSDMPPTVAKALVQLNRGQMSTPIPTIGGTYLIYVQDRRGGGPTTLVHIKQALMQQDPLMQPLKGKPFVTDDQAKTIMSSLSSQARTCDALTALASSTRSVNVTDLGEVDVTALNKTIQVAVQNLGDAGVSEPITTPAGIGLVAVCGRRVVSPHIQSENEIYNELFLQSMETRSKREARDLRAQAYVSGN
jgi:peptidyl-prolyl cis-trans isomerase SurA